MDDLSWCIEYLKKINGIASLSFLTKEETFRALMNITLPINLSEEFYRKENDVLKDILSKKDIYDVKDILKDKRIAIWQGDITLIKGDAIVNAGNSQLLGCFQPLHSCIDNAIHSFAGLEVRRDLMNILNGRNVSNGEVIVTKGYNLPSKYIIHTVGPIYNGNKQNEEDLKKCYINSLEMAIKMNLNNIVFCSISTGVYGYPIKKAAEVAIQTVKEFLQSHDTSLGAVFDLFSDNDYQVYKNILEREE